MPREARKRSETDYYHIVMRGNNKSTIFADKPSKVYLMELLNKIEQEEDIDVAAWCIMDNHVHMVIRVGFEDFERIFKRLNVSFAMYHHKRHKSVGHVFQGRVKSLPLESDESLINNIRYVHNNPVSAGMVARVEDYRWSSYNVYLSKDLKPVMIMVKNIIGRNNKAYSKFHKSDDQRHYLEIKEDQEIIRAKNAQKAIEDICRKYGIVDSKEIYSDRAIQKEIVVEVIARSGFSGRKTADFLGMSEGMVRRLRGK